MKPFSVRFMELAFGASLFTGMALSIIGLFILVRRISFSGLAVSQMAALGTVLGTLLGMHYGEFGFALAAVGIGMLVISRASRIRTVPHESWVACLYILCAGAAVLILAKEPQGESHTLNVFFGNVLALGAAEVWESLAVLAVTGAVIWAWFHRWIWLSFDPLSAEVSKIRIARWNFLFFLLFAVAMTVSIHVCGVSLAFAYLLLPAVIGLTLVRHLKSLFFFIPLVTFIVTLLGFYASFRLDFPTGPFIAAFLGALALIAGAVRSLRQTSGN